MDCWSPDAARAIFAVVMTHRHARTARHYGLRRSEWHRRSSGCEARRYAKDSQCQGPATGDAAAGSVSGGMRHGSLNSGCASKARRKFRPHSRKTVIPIEDRGLALGVISSIPINQMRRRSPNAFEKRIQKTVLQLRNRQ